MPDYSTPMKRGYVTYYVEDSVKRKGSSVVLVNVILLALLITILALGMSGRSAQANLTPPGQTSVESLQLRAASTSISYADARDAGISAWQGKSPVRVFKSSRPTVVFYQSKGPEGSNTGAVGMFIPWSAGYDQIFFYSGNIQKYNFNFYDKRWIGTHELGHALGLAHYGTSNSCGYSIMCPVRTSNQGLPWRPLKYDISEVNRRW